MINSMMIENDDDIFDKLIVSRVNKINIFYDSKSLVLMQSCLIFINTSISLSILL